jgi:hypothetical protein
MLLDLSDNRYTMRLWMITDLNCSLCTLRVIILHYHDENKARGGAGRDDRTTAMETTAGWTWLA